MTAIGFLMIITGFVGASIAHNLSSVPNWVESVFAAIFFVGCVTFTVGLVVLMWRYLP